MLILVKLLALACNFTKINTPPWVLFTIFKLYKCCQMAQRTTYMFYKSMIMTDNDHYLSKKFYISVNE